MGQDVSRHTLVNDYGKTHPAMDLFLRINLVCPTCLRRECPHAEHHDNPCTAVPPGSGIEGELFGAAEAAEETQEKAAA